MSEEQVGPWWAASPSRREGVGVQPEEERNKSQKKRKHLPAGLGPGPQGSPTHHERSVGILIHCRSTGERKSFFLSLSVRPCPSIPAGVTADGPRERPLGGPRLLNSLEGLGPPPR